MDILHLQRGNFSFWEPRATVREKKRETLSHPEITCSLFAPYPLWLRSLVITVPCYCFSLSLSVSLFSCSVCPCYVRKESRGTARKVLKRSETIPLLTACCLRDQQRLRDKSLKSSDHLGFNVCLYREEGHLLAHSGGKFLHIHNLLLVTSALHILSKFLHQCWKSDPILTN